MSIHVQLQPYHLGFTNCPVLLADRVSILLCFATDSLRSICAISAIFRCQFVKLATKIAVCDKRILTYTLIILPLNVTSDTIFGRNNWVDLVRKPSLDCFLDIGRNLLTGSLFTKARVCTLTI
jgi:hypothetical protein